MSPTPSSSDGEAERLATLLSLRILDTDGEEEFDRVTELARALARAEFSVISLIDRERQWFKSKAGPLEGTGGPRSTAFCAHTIVKAEGLWVPDARLDDRFRGNPAVLEPPFLRFYAGAPLTVAGQRIGTLCVFDSRPREYDEHLAQQLSSLAEIVAHRLAERPFRLLATNLIKTTADAVIGADSERRVTYWSASAERMFGFTADEMVGQNVDTLVPYRLRRAYQGRFARIIDGRGSKSVGRTLEVTALRKNGLEFPVDVTLSTWLESGKREVGAIVRDATDRAEAARVVSCALDRERAANRAKDEFLANMSHEIRTPLNGVIGLAGVLSRTIADPTSTKLICSIEKSAEYLDHILADVLDYSRISAGSLTLVKERFDLWNLLAELHQELQPQAAVSQLALTLNLQPGCECAIRADPLRVKQIVSNLITNALKFTETGEISLSARRDHGLFIIEVADTGIGFGEEAAMTIFDRFKQAESTTTRRYGGSGLGLAIGKSLAEQMGGTLEATSEVGVGSVFTFKLPEGLVHSVDGEESDGVVDAFGSCEEQESSQLRVLLAEDHETNRLVANMILQSVGALVVNAENGWEAVEAFRLASFDVVLMDLQMPVMDGLTAIREIRRFESGVGAERTAIVVVSANDTPEDRCSTRAAGADGHLGKPLSAEALLAEISRLIGERPSTQKAGVA